MWNVNSTATGGGVAEMLQVLVGYILGAGVAVRWLVIAGDPAVLLDHQAHPQPSPRCPRRRGRARRRGGAPHTSPSQTANAGAIAPQVRPGDVVILHDPQTAGLAAPLQAAGAVVVWRCHVGTDARNEWTEEAWAFLRPHLASCDGFVFTRREYVPAWVPTDRVSIIPPSIDPFSPKNQELSDARAAADPGRDGPGRRGAPTRTGDVHPPGRHRWVWSPGGPRSWPKGRSMPRPLWWSRCRGGTT